MIGYKAFDMNLKCHGMQFEVGKTYRTSAKKEDLKLCTDTVIHFCRELYKIEMASDYRLFESRICEIIATGDIVDDGVKFGTNEILILRELTFEEKEKFCSRNTGYRNTGYRNTGDCNTGDWNTGNWNTGNCNTGNWNTGDCNTGNWNTGNWNTGNRNTGNWNTGNRNTGYFNTDTQFIRMFNKETSITFGTFGNLSFPSFLYFDLTIWISHDTANDEEKEIYKKEIEETGGFLKKLEYKEAFRLAWDKAPKKEHKMLLALPNWDNEIFKEISGIDAEKEIAEEDE